MVDLKRRVDLRELYHMAKTLLAGKRDPQAELFLARYVAGDLVPPGFTRADEDFIRAVAELAACRIVLERDLKRSAPGPGAELARGILDLLSFGRKVADRYSRTVIPALTKAIEAACDDPLKRVNVSTRGTDIVANVEMSDGGGARRAMCTVNLSFLSGLPTTRTVCSISEAVPNPLAQALEKWVNEEVRGCNLRFIGKDTFVVSGSLHCIAYALALARHLTMLKPVWT